MRAGDRLATGSDGGNRVPQGAVPVTEPDEVAVYFEVVGWACAVAVSDAVARGAWLFAVMGLFAAALCFGFVTRRGAR